MLQKGDAYIVGYYAPAHNCGVGYGRGVRAGSERYLCNSKLPKLKGYKNGVASPPPATSRAPECAATNRRCIVAIERVSTVGNARTREGLGDRGGAERVMQDLVHVLLRIP